MSEAGPAEIHLGFEGDVSRFMREGSKLTWQHRAGKFGEIDQTDDVFSSSAIWWQAPLLDLPNPHKIGQSMESDGLGTKPEVVERHGNYATAAHDLIAMVCDDPAAKGFEPVIANTVLTVNQVKTHMRPKFKQLVDGMVEASKIAGIAISSGETADHGSLIGGYGDPDKMLHFDWSGTVLSVVHKDRYIHSRDIQAGDSIVGLRENGFRCNGFRLVRHAFRSNYGDSWHTNWLHNEKRKLGELALEPSTIYTGALVDMTGGYDERRVAKAILHGAAHITGGGIPEKLGRLLELSGRGAEISEPYEPSDAMKRVQTLSGLPDQEIYNHLNMRHGMLLVTPGPEKVIGVAAEHGLSAKIVGSITQEPGIKIRSAGVRTPGRRLAYNY